MAHTLLTGRKIEEEKKKKRSFPLFRKNVFPLSPYNVIESGEDYEAVSAGFDGTNDYLSNTSTSGLSDTKVVLLNFWLRTADTGSTQVISQSIQIGGPFRLNILVQPPNYQIIGRNATDTQVVRVDLPLIDTAWHHHIVAFDLANASNRAWYADGVEESPTWVTYTDDVIDFSQADGWFIGATSSGGAKLEGDLANYYVKLGGTYTDPATVLDTFIVGGKPPADPPTDGQFVFFGDLDDWHTNKGSAGGFTENGALTDGHTPVEVGSGP